MTQEEEGFLLPASLSEWGESTTEVFFPSEGEDPSQWLVSVNYILVKFPFIDAWTCAYRKQINHCGYII